MDQETEYIETLGQFLLSCLEKGNIKIKGKEMLPFAQKVMNQMIHDMMLDMETTNVFTDENMSVDIIDPMYLQSMSNHRIVPVTSDYGTIAVFEVGGIAQTFTFINLLNDKETFTFVSAKELADVVFGGEEK